MLDRGENKNCSKVTTLAARCRVSALVTDSRLKAIFAASVSSGDYTWDNDAPSQKERRIRPRHFPRHHRRGQEDSGGREKASDLCAGRRGGRCLLCSKRQSE